MTSDSFDFIVIGSGFGGSVGAPRGQLWDGQVPRPCRLRGIHLTSFKLGGDVTSRIAQA